MTNFGKETPFAVYEAAEMEIVEVLYADIICTSPGGSAEGDGDGSNAGDWY